MKQLTLSYPTPSPSDTVKKKKTTLLVSTMATSLHKQHVIDIGYEYVATALDADKCGWRDHIPNISQYSVIGFSVIYPMFLLNIAPFLKRHGISPRRRNRNGTPKVIIGGQGATNLNGALDDIADEIYYGEIDGDYIDQAGWHRSSKVKNKLVVQNNRSILEVTRGCKWRCGFCEYAHVLGGKYREKPIEIVKEQIKESVARGVKRITFRTANLSGCSYLDELIEYAMLYGVYQGWADVTVKEASKITKWLKKAKITAPKIGIESFDEKTRRRIGGAKDFTDDQLEEVMVEMIDNSSLIHIFLIYGLPGDDYNQWYKWIDKLGKMRKRCKHPLRIDLSITNFNPCPNTPLANANQVNFAEKDAFLVKYCEAMKKAGFYKETWDVRYGRDYGRHGRRSHTYHSIMLLRWGSGEELTNKICDAFPNGIGRSMSEHQAKRFLN